MLGNVENSDSLSKDVVNNKGATNVVDCKSNTESEETQVAKMENLNDKSAEKIENTVKGSPEEKLQDLEEQTKKVLEEVERKLKEEEMKFEKGMKKLNLEDNLETLYGILAVYFLEVLGFLALLKAVFIVLCFAVSVCTRRNYLSVERAARDHVSELVSKIWDSSAGAGEFVVGKFKECFKAAKDFCSSFGTASGYEQVSAD